MHSGAMAKVHRAVIRRHREPAASCVGIEPAVVRLTESGGVKVFDATLQLRHLERNRRDVERAAFRVVRVDVLGLADAADLIDGIEQRARKRHAAAARRWIAQQRLDAVRHADAPAAVAPARAVPDALGLEHTDAKRGIAFLQVIRAPQSGVAGADDRDVDLRRQRRDLERRDVADRIEPEADVGQRALHEVVTRSRPHPEIFHDAKAGCGRELPAERGEFDFIEAYEHAQDRLLCGHRRERGAGAAMSARRRTRGGAYLRA